MSKSAGSARKTRLGRILATGLLLTVLLIISAGPALAAGPVTQEDPSAAKVVFSGLTLLSYYSASLDAVLQRDPAAAGQAFAGLPLANIPAALNDSNAAFSRSGPALAAALADLYPLWERQGQMVSQYRLDEAADLFKQISDGLPQASRDLAELNLAVNTTGSYLKIDTLPPDNELKRVFLEIQAKMERLANILDLLKKPLFDTGGSGQPTFLTLEVDPPAAFVGDNISFRGFLTASGLPLAGREITLWLDDQRLAGAFTDDTGAYEGRVSVPYQYQPEIKVQAVFSPRDADTGRLLGASSPLFNLKALYYTASLGITPEGRAYPGRGLALKGVFDYSGAPGIDRAAVSVSLDDTLISRFTASPQFNLSLPIPADLAPGFHRLTFFAPANQRYSPATASLVVEVSLAPTHLQYRLPGVAFAPGGFDFKGQVYSDIGPLQGASLEVRLGKATVSAASAAGGAFSTHLKLSPGFNLLGAQSISIQIQPQEPWNAPLTQTASLFIINWAACGALLLVILATAVVFSLGWRKWWRNRFSVRSPVSVALSATREPAWSSTAAAFSGPKPQEDEKSADTVSGLYRAALLLIQKMTGAALKPYQTLREFARQNGPAMGPLGKPFMEFTLLIEKRLYSRQGAAAEDLARARQLLRSIRGEESSREKR